MVVVAHPDDEAFCSGWLCRLAEQGVEIRVLCLTRGEGKAIPGLSREEIGRVRSREMENACAILGVREVRFLDYEDPTAWEYRTFAPKVSLTGLAEALIQHLSLFQPGLVITHGCAGEYGHPAHMLANSAALRAARQLRPSLRQPLFVATTNAWHPDHSIPAILNREDRAHLQHHSTPAQNQRRLLALQAHRTQWEVFEKFAGGTLRDFIDRTAIENYRLRVFLPAGLSNPPVSAPRVEPGAPPVPSGRTAGESVR